MSRNPHSFTSYLRSQRRRADPIGEFARDWLSDTHAHRPRGAYTYPAVHAYLSSRHASPRTLGLARLAWDEWSGGNPNSPSPASVLTTIQRHATVDFGASPSTPEDALRALRDDLLALFAASK